jgi:carbonic anhydrase
MDALERLKQGNARFVAGEPSRVRADPERLREAARGQKPFAAVLACSDSRVPVEFVFDQGVGDLFVVRTAGNTAGGHEVASLAFAVSVLKIPVVVVMGHTDCGAIRAAVCPDRSIEELGPITEEIAAAADRVPGADRIDPDQSVIDAVSRSHVGDVIRLLIDRSAVLRGRVSEGTCGVVGALYDTATGRVDFLDGDDHRPGVVVRPARSAGARPGG